MCALGECDMAKLPRIYKRLTEEFDLRKARDISSVSFVKVPGVVSSGVRDVIKVKNVTFANCSFAQQVFKGVEFHSCKFYNCVFNGAAFLECNFHDCVMVESVFYKTSFTACYLNPDSFIFDQWKWLRNFANVNAWLYWELFKNAKNMHQEKFAMKADRKFLLYKRYEHIFGRKRDVALFLRDAAFDWGLGCGYGVINSLVVTALMISMFAFMMVGRVQDSDETGVAGVLNILYYSVVSFTTVGYGDYLPMKDYLSLGVTIGFLLLSVIWGAIVTAIVVKRIVR